MQTHRPVLGAIIADAVTTLQTDLWGGYGAPSVPPPVTQGCDLDTKLTITGASRQITRARDY